MDTPRNGKDFYNLESPRNHRKFPRQLATMINGTTEEWDCAMFFYAILYSDCLRHGVIEQVRFAWMISECCAMKLLIGLRPTSHTQPSLRSALELRRHLNHSTSQLFHSKLSGKKYIFRLEVRRNVYLFNFSKVKVVFI